MIRKYFFICVIALVSFSYTAQLVYLQLVQNKYKLLSDNNAILKQTIYPERGLIYDRNGILLVGNQPAYNLLYVPENDYAFDTLEVCQIISISKNDLIRQIRKAKKYSYKLPSIITQQISQEEYALFQEKNWKFPGFYLQKKSIRDYHIQSMANVLGYISEVNSNELKNRPNYELGEQIGRQGIERTYEKFLRGKKGVAYFQKDRFNRIIGPYEEGIYDQQPTASSNLFLTIDYELQNYGANLLQNKRGGIVAIEPETGEVLALITAPNYEPKNLEGRKRSNYYNLLRKDTISKPLFDRALQAEYAPGSPFKLLNGLIGLEEKVINPKTSFICQGGHYYARNAFMECHLSPGTVNDLVEGIYRSCNTYFAQTYKGIINSSNSVQEGIDKWNYHLKSFGLGDYLGYDLPTGRPGFIPNSQYYDRWYPNKSWSVPTVISNAIGQGEILTTPIQMANFTAAIANRGYFIRPHFTKNTTDSMDLIKKKTSISPENFKPIIQGMHQVVEKGTARIAKIKGIEICGKTGTVENFIKLDGKKTQLTDHSIFVAFAPKENPKIAIAVFIEHGYWGSRWAAPIASLMIEKYLNKKIQRKRLENQMLNGNLEAEYKKPYLGKPFLINE
tara:strand:+ start:9804 stop:11657 length:1854 start_codon:yes stop_codon:yes gene_type:complete